MIEDKGHEQLSRPIMKNLRVTVELLRHRFHAATFVGLNASRRLILPVQRTRQTPGARKQLSTAMLDDGECSEAVHFQFVNPVGIVERSGPLQKRHWLELKTHHCFQNSRVHYNRSWPNVGSGKQIRVQNCV